MELKEFKIIENFFNFLMIEQIFLSSHVKRNVIISNKLVYKSCLRKCQTTLDLGSQQIWKYQENLKTS